MGKSTLGGMLEPMSAFNRKNETTTDDSKQPTAAPQTMRRERVLPFQSSPREDLWLKPRNQIVHFPRRDALIKSSQPRFDLDRDASA